MENISANSERGDIVPTHAVSHLTGKAKIHPRLRAACRQKPDMAHFQVLRHVALYKVRTTFWEAVEYAICAYHRLYRHDRCGRDGRIKCKGNAGQYEIIVRAILVSLLLLKETRNCKDGKQKTKCVRRRRCRLVRSVRKSAVGHKTGTPLATLNGTRPQ